ncbi:MAG: dihydrodipicolinate synthase family protein [Caldilineaceae bacterium]|nr:dihydrodipicolinate synthase family protein [Caldilineaceae bacterium]
MRCARHRLARQRQRLCRVERRRTTGWHGSGHRASRGPHPGCLGCSGGQRAHARAFSQRAKEVGADAVIAMTPYVQELEDEESIVRYYETIGRAAQLPIFIQNHARGSVLSISTMVRLLNEVEQVEYVKEETFPVTHKITGLIEQGGDKLKGVFGGVGGRYLLQEYPRGVAGQMPGCHVTDVVVRLWNALEASDWVEAKRVFGLMSPLFALETLRGSNYPEVLRRRGVTSSARSRLSTTPPTIDAHDYAALDDILRDLEPLFTWSNGPLKYGPPEDAGVASQRLADGSSNVATFDRAG